MGRTRLFEKTCAFVEAFFCFVPERAKRASFRSCGERRKERSREGGGQGPGESRKKRSSERGGREEKRVGRNGRKRRKASSPDGPDRERGRRNERETEGPALQGSFLCG